ncbi:MAG: SIR2 family protein, partial [Pseudomonadota bacterium]|nr:SIR2 family protein [Pseudomonadota bacterium]
MSYDDSQENIAILAKEYAEQTRRTVFFVGAGGSTEVGLPTWSTLREGLLNAISRGVLPGEADDETMESFRELEELSEDNDRFWDFFAHSAKYWPTIYADFLTSQFDEVIPEVETPKVYNRIWSMRHSRQVFTLNVDGLVARSFRELRPDARTFQLLEFDGFNVMDSLSYFARDNYCVMNLHGTYHQKSRWIMDGDQRSRLMSGETGSKYAAYVTRLFSEYNVVFVGLNPADVAISPFLSRAAALSLMGRHFWICPSPNPETVRWSEKNGVRLIRYSPSQDEHGRSVHSQDICAILDQVEAFISRERRVELPATSKKIDPKSLPEPVNMVSELSTDRPNAIEKLSGAVTSVGELSGYSSREMENFLSKYSVAVQLASTVDAKTSGFNIVGDYQLLDKVHSGGSSSVWIVESSDRVDSSYKAMKLLSSTGLGDAIERQSFRRGIESLYLLTKSGEKIAPKYEYHYELPLAVIMENIAGSTLREFRESQSNVPAPMALELFSRVGRAVLTCHQSDGQVLHRDVKPGNILLEGWFVGYELSDIKAAKVRLINFDLSWHRFTSGNTKSISADDIGYYAPEQRLSANTLPPRTASTDVYMLGMVLYFLVSGENPPDGGARVKDWEAMVRQKVRIKVDDVLISNRVSRLICEMTEPEPDR